MNKIAWRQPNKIYKVFFQDLPGKKTLEISFGWRQADFSKYYNNRMYWHPCSIEPLYTRHREPLQYKIQTNGQTNNHQLFMINKRDSYKILSEDTFPLGKDILKIPGNTKHYLEFYRVVLVVSQCLVYRGSTSKRTSTQRYCSTFSPLVGGGMEVDILPPSLPSG